MVWGGRAVWSGLWVLLICLVGGLGRRPKRFSFFRRVRVCFSVGSRGVFFGLEDEFGEFSAGDCSGGVCAKFGGPNSFCD